MSGTGTSSGIAPLSMTDAGPVPQSPSALLAQLISIVSSMQPGYTANLPGSLIEDVSSTEVGGLVLIDQARVDLINSISPFGANPAVLGLLGQVYLGPIDGALQNETNTSVYCVFTGTPGFVIAKGFTVTDGSYQYALQDGGIVPVGGVTIPLFFVATQVGIWAVPANTVTTLVTSIPNGITLEVTNPLPGTPGDAEESLDDYRSRVLQAGLAVAQGFPTLLKTMLAGVSGVQPRLISPIQVNGGGWEILVGGGDPYQVAYAIYRAMFDISGLVGSTMSITGITNANPGVVTTLLNHGYVSGNTVTISGAKPNAFNNAYVVTVIDEKTFSIPVDTSGYGSYTGGGICTPNARNIVANIIDYPNSYAIPFVNPPQQSVTMTVTWNTSSANYVSAAGVAALAAPAIASYVNSIYAGQPMNQFVLNLTFQEAVAPIIPVALLTRLEFSVSINGVGAAPEAGTGIIAGDPESFFFTDPQGSGISVVQG